MPKYRDWDRDELPRRQKPKKPRPQDYWEEQYTPQRNKRNKKNPNRDQGRLDNW